MVTILLSSSLCSSRLLGSNGGSSILHRSAACLLRRPCRLLSSSSLSSLQGPPQRRLVPPGQCQFDENFTSVPLLERTTVSPTSSLLRFGLPDATQPLNLSTCACLLAAAELPTNTNESGNKNDDETELVVRPYTPVSTNAQSGSFDLLVKDYGPTHGRFSHFLCETMAVGDTVDFKHIPFNVKIQASSFLRDGGGAAAAATNHILMLAGGTGITPMVQALHAILGDDDAAENNKTTSSTTHVTLLYGNQTSQDILAKDLLDRWQSEYSDRFTVHHVLSKEQPSSSWTGFRGLIDKDMIEVTRTDKDMEYDWVFVCGPPPMYEALCGPRDEPEQITGVLAELGYTAKEVYKF